MASQLLLTSGIFLFLPTFTLFPFPSNIFPVAPWVQVTQVRVSVRKGVVVTAPWDVVAAEKLMEP